MGFGSQPKAPAAPIPDPPAKSYEAEEEADMLGKRKRRNRLSMDKTVQTPTLGGGAGTGLPQQGGRTTLG